MRASTSMHLASVPVGLPNGCKVQGKSLPPYSKGGEAGFGGEKEFGTPSPLVANKDTSEMCGGSQLQPGRPD